MFLAKYGGADGHYVWDTLITGTATIYANSVAADSQNNILLTGQFCRTYSFGTQALTADNSNAFIYDGFVAKYSASGAPVWASNIVSLNAADGNSVAVDASGNSFVAGSLQGTATFGSQLLTSIGSVDTFLMKLNP
jgi:hypothetical protein